MSTTWRYRHGETPRLIQRSYGYRRTDNPIPVDGIADPKDEEEQMTWWIFVDMTRAQNVQEYGNTRGGGEQSFTYRRSDSRHEECMTTLLRWAVPGGEFVECKFVKPELPAAFQDIVPVRRVTAVGKLPQSKVTPGLYELGEASAEVRACESTEGLKIRLTAPNCVEAWNLYRAILRNEENIRVISY